MNARSLAVLLNGGAKFFQGQLGVVPCAGRLDTVVTPSANNPASSTADLTCALAMGMFVLDGFQFCAMNFQRREIIFARANVRAHFAQRADDALHRAAFAANRHPSDES